MDINPPIVETIIEKFENQAMNEDTSSNDNNVYSNSRNEELDENVNDEVVKEEDVSQDELKITIKLEGENDSPNEIDAVTQELNKMGLETILEEPYSGSSKNLKSSLNPTTTPSPKSPELSLSPENCYQPLLSFIDIGIGALPEQRMQMVAKRGGSLNLMILGQTGLGKSTFINTLFGTNLYETNSSFTDVTIPETPSISISKFELTENNFRLNLNVIKAPGFGDSADNLFSWSPVCSYIDNQMRSYLFQEEQPDRTKLVDNRVHICLYFVSPSSNGLKPFDIISIKHLSERVNLIPIIPKADSYTKEEMMKRKSTIRALLKQHDIDICHYLDGNDDAYKTILTEMPYSVLGVDYNSSTILEADIIKGRHYSWGTVLLEDENHCDFLKLRKVLLENNMLDLIQSTENHYEKYRKDILKFRLYQVEEGNNEKQVTTGSNDIGEMFQKNPKTIQILSKLSEFEYSPKVDGLGSLKSLKKFGYEEFEKIVVDIDPLYAHGQNLLKKKISEIVADQDKKFRVWKKALYEKQTGFNQEIDNFHSKIYKLHETITYLTGIGSGSTTTSGYESYSGESSTASFTNTYSGKNTGTANDNTEEDSDSVESSSESEAKNETKQHVHWRSYKHNKNAKAAK